MSLLQQQSHVEKINLSTTLKVYMTFFLFARSNLPNVLISIATKFFP